MESPFYFVLTKTWNLKDSFTFCLVLFHQSALLFRFLIFLAKAISVSLMKKYLLVFFTCLSFLVGHSQEEANALLRVYVQSDSLVKGECTVLTVSVFVNEQNTVAMRFHELQKFPVKEIMGLFPFYGNSRIRSIQGERSRLDDEMYTEYELFEFGVCPFEDVVIPEFELKMLKQADSSLIPLKSDELVITVRDSEKSSAAELVGEFKLDAISESLGELVGDTSIFEYRIQGFGNLFQLMPDDMETDQYIATTEVKSFYDSVYYSIYYQSEKVFRTKIIHKKPGTINMRDVINFSTYSLRLDRADTLTIPTVFDIEGTPKSLGKSEPSRLAIVIDNSQSMGIEDYVPHRFAAAQEFANGLLKTHGDSYYLVSGAVTKIGQSYIADSILTYNHISGSSLGNGLWYAIHELKKVEGKKAIVLLTDGDATSGNVDPKDMALFAKEHGIQIFTIGVGSPGKVPYGTDFFGRPRLFEDTFNDNELKEVAHLSDGKYFVLPKNDLYRIEEIKEEILDRIGK